MPRFAIAFALPEDTRPLRHSILESETKDGALKTFFEQELSEIRARYQGQPFDIVCVLGTALRVSKTGRGAFSPADPAPGLPE